MKMKEESPETTSNTSNYKIDNKTLTATSQELIRLMNITSPVPVPVPPSTTGLDSDSVLAASLPNPVISNSVNFSNTNNNNRIASPRQKKMKVKSSNAATSPRLAFTDSNLANQVFSNTTPTNNNNNNNSSSNSAMMNNAIGDLDVWPGGGGRKNDFVKPHLLKKLETYINTEMNAMKLLSSHSHEPNPARVEVYRQAFMIFADEFKSYTTFLANVRYEYDSLLNAYSEKLQNVPEIYAEVARLRKGNGREVENLMHQFDEERKVLNDKLNVQIKTNLINENENNELREQLTMLTKESAVNVAKYDELKHSSYTLTNAIVRLENENRSRELLENVQQSDNLRFKNALEKSNSEVDRLNSISVDMEEVMSSLIAPEVLEEKERQVKSMRKEMGLLRIRLRTVNDKYVTLKDAFDSTKADDKETPNTANTTSAVVSDLVNKIEKLRLQIEESKALEKTSLTDNNIENEAYKLEGHYFDSRGLSDDIPKFLRYDGPLRNWRLSKREAERAVNDVWIAKEEWLQEHFDAKSIHLSDYIYIYLEEKYEGNIALIAEFGYNLIDALDRYIADSDCKIFLKILQGELAEEVREDQIYLLVEIPRIMEDEDYAIHNNVVTGLLPIPIFMRVLRKILTTKSDHSFQKLQKALQYETKRGRNVSYNELFEEDEEGNQGDFCELLRAQHLEEIIAYDKLLNDMILDAASKEKDDSLLTIAALRELIELSDPKRLRAGVNIYLARGCDCTISEVMERESNGVKVDVEDFIERLRDGLLKKTEKAG